MVMPAGIFVNFMSVDLSYSFDGVWIMYSLRRATTA